MFHATRLKLTAYYLLIIMVISTLFSVFIYRQLTDEFDRIVRSEKARMERQLSDDFFQIQGITPKKIVYINQDVIEESKKRILLMLLLVNAGILSLSAVAGYFLAGRTLRPIQEMMDQQNQFITDASHELRTPLTALKTEIEVALRDQKITLKEAKELLESNLEEVNSLQLLSDSMMQLAQNPVQKNITFEPLSLKEEISQSIKKTSPMAKNKKIAIIFEGKDFLVKGEKGSVREIMTILLDNAIKYSDNNTTVSINIRSNDGHVIVEITDQGTGIATEDLPFLFDRFFRSDKSRSKTDTDGFGLGLSIAKKLVDSMNGKIEVSSVENQGTSFFITLPKLKTA